MFYFVLRRFCSNRCRKATKRVCENRWLVSRHFGRWFQRDSSLRTSEHWSSSCELFPRSSASGSSICNSWRYFDATVWKVQGKVPTKFSTQNAFWRSNRTGNFPALPTSLSDFCKSSTTHLLLARKSIDCRATAQKLHPCQRQSMPTTVQWRLTGPLPPALSKMSEQTWLCWHRRRIWWSPRSSLFPFDHQKCKFFDFSVKKSF